MLDVRGIKPYKWQSRTVCSAPVRLLSNVHERMQQMPKPYFRSNYAEVKTQFEPPFDNCFCIPLTDGKHTIIDAEDYDFVSGGPWQAKKASCSHKYYVVRKEMERALDALIAIGAVRVK